jgi:hypothetical protein
MIFCVAGFTTYANDRETGKFFKLEIEREDLDHTVGFLVLDNGAVQIQATAFSLTHNK